MGYGLWNPPKWARDQERIAEQKRQAQQARRRKEKQQRRRQRQRESQERSKREPGRTHRKDWSDLNIYDTSIAPWEKQRVIGRHESVAAAKAAWHTPAKQYHD